MSKAETNRGAPVREKSTELVFQRERRHSRNVRLLKIALPAGAVLLTLGLVAQSMLPSFGDVSVDLLGSTIDGDRIIMANPRMSGLNAQNRAYEMTAARAIQDMGNPDEMDLEQISARVPVGTSEWADIAADRGTMFKERNTIEIATPATVKTTDGMTARLATATIDMGKGDISTDEGVQIDHEGSQVTAQSLRVTNGGTVLVFEQQVKVFIQGGRFTTASTATGDANAEH